MSEPLAEPLEARAERPQMNPRLWMVLGVSYVIIGERHLRRQSCTASSALRGKQRFKACCLCLPRSAIGVQQQLMASKADLSPSAPLLTWCPACWPSSTRLQSVPYAHMLPAPPGIVELCLAALWRFWLGVALGFGVAKMGTSLCGMTLAARPPPSPASGCFGWLRNLGRRALMWGASKMQVREGVAKSLQTQAACCVWPGGKARRCDPRLVHPLPPASSGRSAPQALFFFFRWLIYGYGLLVLLMLLIHVASPDYRWANFPSGCPPDKRFGCRWGAAPAAKGRHASRVAPRLPTGQGDDACNACARSVRSRGCLRRDAAGPRCMHPPPCARRSRIAESNPHNARHLQPLHLNAALPDVQAQVRRVAGGSSGRPALRAHSCGSRPARVVAGSAEVRRQRSFVCTPMGPGCRAGACLPALWQVESWVKAQAQATLLGDTRSGFVHARVLTLFWGFADDTMVSLR